MWWRYRASLVPLLAVVAAVQLWGAASAYEKGTACALTGIVLDADSRKPVAGASIQIEKLGTGVATDTVGKFTLKDLPEGIYAVKISHIGYETQTTNIAVSRAVNVPVTVMLVPQAVVLSGIVVTPGQAAEEDSRADGRRPISQQSLSNMPEFGDDSFRAAARLPGLTSGDFSARFAVRGGEFDEVLVSLDGMRLYEPFHLKDLDGGALSILDGAVLEKIDVYTGGFPARYGDKMSGVFDMQTRPVIGNQRRVQAGISLLAAKALAEGTFSDSSGSWLLSLRRGYLEYLTGVSHETKEISPKYHDLFTRLKCDLSPSASLAFHTLYFGDHIEFLGEDENPGDTLIGRYDNLYVWLTFRFGPSRKLSMQSILSAGKIAHDRLGSMGTGHHTLYAVADKRDFDFVGSKTDIQLGVWRWFHLNAGLEAQALQSHYDHLYQEFFYDSHVTPHGIESRLYMIDTSMATLTKTGARFGSYLSGWASAGGVDAEVGVRWDRASYTDDNLVSPRVSLAWTAIRNTTVRAAWGDYYQIQEVDQIGVNYGDTMFHRAQKAEHAVLSLEHRLNNGVLLKAEGYRKRYSHLRPAFRTAGNRLSILPQVEYDATVVLRKSGDSRGLELSASKDVGGRCSWWITYGLARVRENVVQVHFLNNFHSRYGSTLPGPQDQRHTLRVDVHIRPSEEWLISSAYQMHTGWPYTEMRLYGMTDLIVADSLWNARFDSFQRLDIRISRRFQVGRGRLTAWAEMLNVLGRENIRFYIYDVRSNDGESNLTRDPQYWLGRIPSFGVSYELEY